MFEGGDPSITLTERAANVSSLNQCLLTLQYVLTRSGRSYMFPSNYARCRNERTIPSWLYVLQWNRAVATAISTRWSLLRK